MTDKFSVNSYTRVWLGTADTRQAGCWQGSFVRDEICGGISEIWNILLGS
jgi:hypothetical protein